MYASSNIKTLFDLFQFNLPTFALRTHLHSCLGTIQETVLHIGYFISQLQPWGHVFSCRLLLFSYLSLQLMLVSLWNICMTFCVFFGKILHRTLCRWKKKMQKWSRKFSIPKTSIYNVYYYQYYNVLKKKKRVGILIGRETKYHRDIYGGNLVSVN